ncbi:hypothetical protein [Azospirillum isscasi]|uniref:Uncharacterized protein n=1 Tax=Azospirillum isscasi TaxID=3053926 RepID=A0ABU0WFA8_9PROT|nr:hypothetical protein [Azospirillum isscasi]MDQ2102743.1 hypothetical protein [Azospirillum isscasi]
MSLAPLRIATHPDIIPALRRQSEALLTVYDEQARLASIFASQQGWLLAMAALAVYFRKQRQNEGKTVGITVKEFREFVELHKITSRNTAETFLKQMLHYGFSVPVASQDRRARPAAPAEQTIAAITRWIDIHLSTLDALDGGNRVGAISGDTTLLGRLQPAITDRLLINTAIREPTPAFAIFTWLNQGGLLMEQLFCGLQETLPDGRIMTNIVSIRLLASLLKLSRSHLHRKLQEAEATGSLGWSGARGQSPMWISDSFLGEMVAYQANKLAIFDATLSVEMM